MGSESLPSISDMVCAAYPSPRVAVCLAGHARTFQQPLVYRSTRANLIEAFGGNVTVMAALKLEDASGNAARAKNHGLVDARGSKVAVALQHLGVAAHNLRLRHGNATASMPARCNSSFSERSHAGSIASFHSLLGQLESRRACHELVLQAEARDALRFDFIWYARPDMVWPLPVYPYCFWDLKQPLRKHDWAYAIPRSMLDEALKQPLERLHACQRTWNTRDTVESHIWALFECPASVHITGHVTKGHIGGRTARYQSMQCFWMADQLDMPGRAPGTR